MSSQKITEILIAWNKGERHAIDQLLPIVEKELRRIAHNYMRKERRNHTLQTTALINEAYMKLIDQRSVEWSNRAHFFALSAQIMRRILLNHARDRIAQKRAGGFEHVDFETIQVMTFEKSRELIALDEALERLAKIDALKSRIVEMRYFGGLTIEEAASVLELAPITISLHWRLARAWLKKEIRNGDEI
jgi:RNA polymerase sigma-70 factor, ECF subfamily